MKIDIDKLKALGLDVDIIAKVASEKPEEAERIVSMFGTYLAKLGIFNSGLNAPRKDIEAVGEQLNEFLGIITWRFVENWCLVEESMNIIKHLEGEIKNLGGDVDAIREKYSNM